MPDASRDKTRVLFIVSPLEIGADTWIHLLLMRHLPQDRFALHAAVQYSANEHEPSPALTALRGLSGIALVETDFGPSLWGQSRLRRLQSARHFLPAALSIFALARYIRRERIQIIHASDRPRDAIACALLAAATGAKAVIHVHVKYDPGTSRGVRWALGRADAIVGVSNFVADSLIRGGYRPERVHAVLNAIDPDSWDPSLSGAPGRESLGVAAETPLIVSIARLFRWKGHAELIRALAIVQREVPDVKLAIVGSDYPAGSGTTEALSALARELAVANSVIFTGHRRDIASLLAASDVFALPSFEEPFGLVYCEAMAMKRPVIALTTGGVPEVVDHERSGLLSPPADIDGLAANLLTLLRAPELRGRLGQHGRVQVETRFAPGRIAGDFAALYARLIS